MKYRNKLTGQTIDFSSRIKSEEWEPVIERVPSFVAVKTEAKIEENVEVAPVQPKKTTSKKKKAE